jgi:hypothetical protein
MEITMVKAIFSRIFSNTRVVATSLNIKGMYSAGMKDQPGTWFK